ncbi:Pentatricopeptide repeat-containing protein [Nymphaea thermarum]|nr:Pentatricopeptide repeat-containing protein [Nymphaea thermarum]
MAVRHLAIACSETANLHCCSHLDNLDRTLRSCHHIGPLKQLHGRFVQLGLHLHLVLSTTLMQAYARSAGRQGAAAASEVLRAQPEPDAFCYNVVVGAWAELGLHDEALGFLALMRRANHRPNRYTFPLLTQTCASLVRLGAIHGLAIRAGYASDAAVATAVLRAYGKLAVLGDARAVFDGIEAADDVAYAAIITTCRENGDGVAALSMFGRSKTNSSSGSGVISASLKACCESFGGLLCGQWIHGYAVRTGLASDSCVSSCLIGLYSQLGDSNDAYKVFVETPERDVVAWNAMISGFACNGFEEEAFRVFMEMVSGNEKPTAGTLVGVIKACCVLENVMMVFPYSLKSGIGEDASVQTSVLDAFVKCRGLEAACLFFDGMPERSVVAWTALMAGFVDGGRCSQALCLLPEMQQENVVPDSGTFVCALLACARTGRLEPGKCIHGYMVRHFTGFSEMESTAISDMYAKCGNMNYAILCFKSASRENLIGWSSMVAAYGRHGQAGEALDLFDCMVNSGARPDRVAFLSVLSACSHAGLVEKGWQYFNRMAEEFGIEPDERHYGCMVDLLGRAGLLDEARSLLVQMQGKATTRAYGALLSACSRHCDHVLASSVVSVLVNGECGDGGVYALLRNMYATEGLRPTGESQATPHRVSCRPVTTGIRA